MIEKSDNLKETSILVDESINPYYTDIYSPWQTKEQLQTGLEVAPAIEVTWLIDTAISYTTINNTYTLNIPSINKIFSIWIDWINNTFYITAYNTFETELRAWLWVNYTVTYVSWWNYIILRNDWRIIIKTSPNLVKKVVLSSFDTISKIDLTIDWTTISLDWATHSWNSWTAFTYLITQLPSSTYYAMVEWTDLVIARIDWTIPTITKTQYNKYDYTVAWFATPSYNYNTMSSTVWWATTISIKLDYYTITIWWTTYTYTLPVTKDNADHTWTYTYNNFTPTAYTHWNYNSFWDYFLDYIYDQLSSYTKTSIVKQTDSWIYVNQVSFTFKNGTRSQITIASNNAQYIRSTWVWITWDTVMRSYIYTNYPWFQVTPFFSITENTHTADMTVSTYTEITITLTNWWWTYYYIPVLMKNIKSVTINAVWNNWNSEWTWNFNDWQSCIARYSSSTYNVSNYIFKTDWSNYGNIISVWIWHIIITWVTNSSNKLSYICK